MITWRISAEPIFLPIISRAARYGFVQIEAKLDKAKFIPPTDSFMSLYNEFGFPEPFICFTKTEPVCSDP